MGATAINIKRKWYAYSQFSLCDVTYNAIMISFEYHRYRRVEMNEKKYFDNDGKRLLIFYYFKFLNLAYY